MSSIVTRTNSTRGMDSVNLEVLYSILFVVKFRQTKLSACCSLVQLFRVVVISIYVVRSPIYTI